jgi:hypothetical protein
MAVAGTAEVAAVVITKAAVPAISDRAVGRVKR